MSAYLAETRYPLELAPAMPDVWELWQRAKTLEWDPETDIPWEGSCEAPELPAGRRLFLGERVDRPPLLEEGVRDEVIELWHSQGLPRDKTHLDVFGLTPHENVGPDLTFDPEYLGRLMNLTPREYRRAFRASRSRFPENSRPHRAQIEGNSLSALSL